VGAFAPVNGLDKDINDVIKAEAKHETDESIVLIESNFVHVFPFRF